jgi:hypothetical protein
VKIYLAELGEENYGNYRQASFNFKRGGCLLFSFYDLTISPFPYRKQTWRILIETLSCRKKL